MFRLSHTLKLIRSAQVQAGFTMIELLIVITILGILATAVLSAINPIEQINRGKDTGSQSDAEQLISAIDRYYAFNGTFPWQGTAAGASLLNAYFTSTYAADGSPMRVTATLAGEDYATSILTELEAKDELKSSFITRIGIATNPLYIYHLGGNSGNSTYVCFAAESRAFKEKADSRCIDVDGSGLPTGDMSADARAFLCAGFGNPAVDTYSCLP